jgi:hypothetical protein
MVKFGRRLLTERNDDWAEHYIDYKVGNMRGSGKTERAFTSSAQLKMLRTF